MNQKNKTPNIKIFVSHRVDQQNEVIHDEVFMPVRCGAALDERPLEMQQNIPGDNTGDNISEKRYRYNEMTVLYWAWKNIDADYYGLCHYRRYFSFNTNRKFKKNMFQVVEDTTLSAEHKHLYHLTAADVKKVIETNSSADIFLPELFDISKINNDKKYNHIRRYKDNLGKKATAKFLDIFFQVIKNMAPDYYEISQQYFKGSKAYFCDTFIMKKKLFFEYCKWCFPIMEELEKNIDYRSLSMKLTRIVAFFSEDLLSIFIFDKIQKKKINIKELQLVYFSNPRCQNKITRAFKNNGNAIVMAINDSYAAIASVMIASIMQNMYYGNTYDILMLETDVSETNKMLLTSMVEKSKNISIRFLDISEEIRGYEFDTSSYGLPAFYRLVTPFVLKDYERILYFDADMVVNKDVAELYSYKLSKGKIIAAVPDIRAASWYNNERDDSFFNYVNEKISLNIAEEKYFNSGVLIIDSKKVREEYSIQDVLTVASQSGFWFPDQDALNILFQKKTEYMPITWNTMVSGDRLETEAFAPLDMFNEYIKARKTPAIVHYAGGLLPMNYGETDMWWYYWQYAKKSPFYPILLYRMKLNVMYAGGVHLSLIRRIADKLLPKGTRRRNLLKRVMPRDSAQFKFFKKLYHKFTV